MAEDDFYGDVAKARIEQLDAEMGRVRANIAIHKSHEDYGSASLELDELADLTNKRNSVVQLYNAQVAASQPQYQAPETETEWREKAPERMNYGDVYKIASKSKYGVDDEAF